MSIGQTPQSFRGYVGIAKESTYAGGPAPSYYIDAISDGMGLDNNVDFQNSTRSRGTHKGEAGPLTDEGSLDLPANPENGLGLLLLGALGSESFTAKDPDSDNTDEVGEHVFSPAESVTSIAAEIDRDTDVVRHQGVGVDTLELAHTSEEMLTASADLIASEPDASVSSATPSYSDLRNFRFHDGSFTLNSSSRGGDITDFTATIENNMDALIRNTRTAGKISIGERVVTQTVTLDFENSDLFEQFLGAGGATSPKDQLTTLDVNATWTSPETVSDTSTAYELDWNAPKCVPISHEANINQDDLIVEDLELRALVDVGGIGSEVEVTLTNGQTSAY